MLDSVAFCIPHGMLSNFKFYFAGTFHLLHLMFDDYVLYVMENLHSTERANDLLRSIKGESIDCKYFTGGSRERPPRVQILSFWHTNFSKHSRFGSWRPLRGGRPLREILDPLLYSIETCRNLFIILEN